MTSPNQSIEPVSEEAIEEVGQMLRDMRSPDEFIKTAASWMSSCLYECWQEKEPQAAPYQILKAILSETLEDLKKENAEYADILQARFWRAQPVKEAAHNTAWSERTFFLNQNKAIKLFAFLLLQKEQVCRQGHGQADRDSAAAGWAAPGAKRPQQMGSLMLVGVLVLLVLGFFLLRGRGLVGFLLPSAAATLTPTADPTQAAPAVAVAPALETQPLTPTLPSPTLTVEPTLQPTPQVAAARPIQDGSFCGEPERLAAPGIIRFVRWQGVSAFTVENTEGRVLSDNVRSLAWHPGGIWIGYFRDERQRGGVGHYDKNTWAECSFSGFSLQESVNAVTAGPGQQVWVGYERHGIAHFDGKGWEHYTTADGLPSDAIYGLTLDHNGVLWAGTWEGVARYDGSGWSVPYSVNNETIFNDRVHAIAFDSENNIWFGHISNGVSQYEGASQKWIYHIAQPHGLGGNAIRKILVQPGGEAGHEAVWFATADGGVSRYRAGEWVTFDLEDGLPSLHVKDLALDRYNRVWAATEAGVVFFDQTRWTLYNTLNTNTIVIGNTCPAQDCIFDDDVVWTGTTEYGLTHSRLPLPEPALEILSVCFVDQERNKVCPELPALEDGPVPVLTVAYPLSLRPGEILRFEVTAATRPPYTLRESRGDFLSNIDASDELLFGAWPVVPVRDTIEPEQPYTFTDHDNPFSAPELQPGQAEAVFSSTWRVWMHTRFVGPQIRLVFKVEQP